MTQPLRIISLGAGVQSSTMALMFAAGEISPMPDAAIFADTGGEPRHVYTWLDWLETQLPFPVHRVMWKEGLTKNIFAALEGNRFAGAPFFTESPTGKSAGMLRRQCTREFKIQPITQKLRELIGLVPRQRAPKRIMVVQYLGISLDESLRMKNSQLHWVEHSWPLIDLRMRRQDCIDWMREHGYPEPQRSACTYCPYHSDDEWRALKTKWPEDFADAVAIDKAIRSGVRGTEQKLYLHRSLQPLDKIDFRNAKDFSQGDMFNNECDGMCGV